MPLKYSTALRNAQLDQITSTVGAGGKLRILTGTQPANVAATETGSLLVEITMDSPFAVAAGSGTLTVTLPASVNATATGTAGYFRLTTAGGTAVMDGDATATGGGGIMQLNTTAIVTGGPVVITAFSISQNNG
jgi:hypothetical protein